jgi:hypothetical protein
MTEEQKLSANTASFSVPRYIDGTPVDTNKVHSTQAIVAAYRSTGTAAHVPSTTTEMMEQYSNLTEEDRAVLLSFSLKTNDKKRLVGKKRKEATEQEKRQFSKQFQEAKKAEYQSWLDNEVFDLVDVRTMKVRNYVTGRWVLTIKRDKEGNFVKCKARWVLRGFQDSQKNAQQTDSPAASRPGFRLAVSAAANNQWDLYHMDLKTAFLQGVAYDSTRDIICELPKESGHPWYMGARMKKPAYGLNDAPRKWWNIVDGKLRSYGLEPTRADRCTYVLYEGTQHRPRGPNQTVTPQHRPSGSEVTTISMEKAIDYLLDPVAGNNARGRKVAGFVCLHVDDLFMGGNSHFYKTVCDALRRDFQDRSEDKHDIM